MLMYYYEYGHSSLSVYLMTIFIAGITPVEGTDETVRVVSMDRDFHVDCYMCCVCGMQLTDEPDKRCYPLAGMSLRLTDSRYLR